MKGRLISEGLPISIYKNHKVKLTYLLYLFKNQQTYQQTRIVIDSTKTNIVHKIIDHITIL